MGFEDVGFGVGKGKGWGYSRIHGCRGRERHGLGSSITPLKLYQRFSG